MTNPHGDRITIRSRVAADLDAAAAALVEVHRTDGYPVEGVSDPQAWLTDAHQLAAWVAELDGRTVGHVALSDPQPSDAAAILWNDDPDNTGEPPAVLGRLFVLREARGHALGEQLVQAAAGYARQHGRRLVLDVMAKDTVATRLYERLGWRRIGTAKHDDGHGNAIDAYCYVSPAR